jgi:DNA-binding response OmpR family regulator
MSGNYILLVDDDRDFTDLTSKILSDDGFSVNVASTGELAESIARARIPDLVIIDVGLPGIKGPELCRRLRKFTTAPIVFLTGATSTADQLVGFAVGANDYITKPCEPQILLARVHTLLDKGLDNSSILVVIDNFEINLQTRIVKINGKIVDLTKIEYNILAFLAQKQGHIIQKAEILQAVWGNWYDGTHTLDVAMSRLRTKLIKAGAPKQLIVTHRGRGYRLGLAV